MNAMTDFWNHLAARVGTEPRKLAILCSIAVVAVGLLGVRFMVAGPKKAAAAPRSPAPAAVTPVAAAPVLMAFALQSVPSRDPFASLGGTATASPSAPGAAGPDSLKLQATMDDSFAVINGKTIKVGADVVDGTSGVRYRLAEVGFRRATLEAGSRRFELRFQE